jgi:endonuclease/exonuclease/phosphatase (EEP) superfamily protein YafD
MRLWESNLARDWAKHAKGPLIVAGDFNLPRESQIFQEAWGSFGDAFDTCGWGFGYSKETRVKGIEFGTRIDHVLFDSSFGCASVKIGPEIGSDHRGVIAELRLR